MRRVFLTSICALAVAFSVAADTEISIRLYDKKIYFSDTPIHLHITVANESPQPFRFKLAEDRTFNMDVHVRNEFNQLVEPTLEFITQRGSQQVFFREISLEPGEEISFVEELTRYSAIDSPGSYVVRVDFFPELYRQGAVAMSSNTLRLVVRPGIEELDLFDATIDVATSEALQKVELSPDKVVEYLITARQDSNWNRFFLYLDLESMLGEHLSLQRQYERSSEADRLRLLDDFRAQIVDGRVDSDITFVPAEFRILRTEFGPRDATVLVEQIFVHPQYREIKQYTYRLSRQDYWYVTGYDVVNTGTQVRS